MVEDVPADALNKVVSELGAVETIAIFFGALLLVIIAVIIIVAMLVKPHRNKTFKQTPLHNLINLFRGKKEEAEAEPSEEVKFNRSTDSQEVVVMIMKISKFKDEEKDIDKDWMTRSMKFVDSILHAEFTSVIEELFKKADPTFYSANPSFLELVTKALFEELKENFRVAIRENNLHLHNTTSSKSEYIRLKSTAFIKAISDNIRTVLGIKGVTSFTVPEDVVRSLNNYLDLIFSKLIDFAMQREESKVEIIEELLNDLESDSDLSSSTVEMIKGVMNIGRRKPKT